MPHTNCALPCPHRPPLTCPPLTCPPLPAATTAPPPLTRSAINSTAVCQAIGRNTIYGGKYDYISTFTKSSQVGGFNKLCLAPKGVQGMYAQVGGSWLWDWLLCRGGWLLSGWVGGWLLAEGG